MISEAHIVFERLDDAVGIETIGGDDVSTHEIKLPTVEKVAPQDAAILSDTCVPLN